VSLLWVGSSRIVTDLYDQPYIQLTAKAILA
jgi:hypothetical protein